jgi:uncharacterized protein (TIGR02246 family)
MADSFDTATPKELVSLVFEVWNSGDPDALGALFPVDGEWTTPYGYPMVGPWEIAEGHRGVMQGIFASAVLECTNVRTKALADTLVSIDARWLMAGQVAPDGKAIPEREGSMHIIAEKGPHGWRPIVLRNQEYAGPYRELAKRQDVAGGNPHGVPEA